MIGAQEFDGEPGQGIEQQEGPEELPRPRETPPQSDEEEVGAQACQAEHRLSGMQPNPFERSIEGQDLWSDPLMDIIMDSERVAGRFTVTTPREETPQTPHGQTEWQGQGSDVGHGEEGYATVAAEQIGRG